VRKSLALALVMIASLAWAQAPAQKDPQAAPPKAPKSQKTQKAQKAQPPQKSHAKPTPEQIRKFNELQRKQGGKP
jgi:hypothetical protein